MNRQEFIGGGPSNPVVDHSVSPYVILQVCHRFDLHGKSKEGLLTAQQQSPCTPVKGQGDDRDLSVIPDSTEADGDSLPYWMIQTQLGTPSQAKDWTGGDLSETPSRAGKIQHPPESVGIGNDTLSFAIPFPPSLFPTTPPRCPEMAPSASSVTEPSSSPQMLYAGRANHRHEHDEKYFDETLMEGEELSAYDISLRRSIYRWRGRPWSKSHFREHQWAIRSHWFESHWHLLDQLLNSDSMAPQGQGEDLPISKHLLGDAGWVHVAGDRIYGNIHVNSYLLGL
ncbi:hypothetical protein M422DRAFT_256591 [Sphaerobolus stellatus SS14]|uniref:Uncharacterized protein n=1 Tax=Sphaerobolus stellatus (strain SS14) TaxID=990650 RepID=A0A0C9V0J0_SPHS4|nr:hypothetical protein M422DRAFT_256591 [Sphaerobolus stellatus SS14]